MNRSISIIVCTLNRAESLRATLQSLLTQTFPSDLHEIIVVDNGSTDHTQSVVKEFQQVSCAPLLSVHEAEQGVSAALNRGILSAKGEVLAFIDDDAQASATWLATLMETFTSLRNVDAVGGPIEPIDPVELPSWLPRRLIPYLGIVNYGAKTKPLKYPRYPFGSNMAFRRTVFDKAGFFDPLLGRKGTSSFQTCQETDIFLRIERSGGLIYYNPSAIVYHPIYSDRLRPAWFYHQAYWIGFSFAVMEQKSMPSLYVIWRGIVSVAIIAGGVAVWTGALVLQRQNLQVYARCVIQDRWGYLHGILKK